MNRAPEYFNHIQLPAPESHKGQNGKVLLIGGSELFHAASKWSLDVISKFVDMVFYASVPSNNELIKQAKGEFWNGIVIERSEIENYLQEADSILIGPGMERTEETASLVNYLLSKYSDKKWVVDAGALQMVEVELLNEHCIITPHQGELERVWNKTFSEPLPTDKAVAAKTLSKKLGKVCVLVKGQQDVVAQGEKLEMIDGGNAGMTKGGTGDVLAGVVAALFAKHDAVTSAVVASYANKKAGEMLYDIVGPFFNASDLVEQIPKALWALLQENNEK